MGASLVASHGFLSEFYFRLFSAVLLWSPCFSRCALGLLESMGDAGNHLLEWSSVTFDTEARRCRSDGHLGNVLASVIASGPTMSVTNPQNQLIAAVRCVSTDTNTRVLTVQYDVDALFMISLVVAVGKWA